MEKNGPSVDKIIKKIGRLTAKSSTTEAEKVLRSYVGKKHKTHIVVTSENDIAKVLSGEYIWLVHILDGSMNLKRGIPYFGTSIAIAKYDSQKNLEIIYAAVYLPPIKELISAEKGKGAYINGKQVQVSQTKTLRGCLGSIAPTMDRFMSPILRSLARYAESEEYRLESEGAGAFHVRYLAGGSRDFWAFEHDPKNKPIHNLTSAASLIIQEAGGKVTTLKGEPWRLGGHSFIATNGHIHDELLKILNN